MDEPARHDSAALIEMISLTIEEVMLMCKEQHRSRPTCLVINADNTVRECKNQFMMSYLHLLVAQHRFRSCAMCFLRKSHTHCRVGHTS